MLNEGVVNSEKKPKTPSKAESIDLVSGSMYSAYGEEPYNNLSQADMNLIRSVYGYDNNVNVDTVNVDTVNVDTVNVETVNIEKSSDAESIQTASASTSDTAHISRLKYIDETSYDKLSEIDLNIIQSVCKRK